MTRGLGVNTTLFGESKGNLVKPGMYEEDLERIEAMKGNPLGDGPDPFGDVFAERKSAVATPSAPAARAPLPPQSEQFGGSRPPPSGALPFGRLQPAKTEENVNPWGLL